MLHHATFDESDIAENTQGAGVVPVAKGPDGRMYALLGREQHVANWKGSCKWSGFEGGRKPSESVEETAVRECAEESLNVCCITREHVQNGNYVCKIVLTVVQNTKPVLKQAAHRFHVTYVVEVPFEENIAERFRSRRLEIMNLHARVRHFRKAMLKLTRIASLVSDIAINETKTVLTFSDGASLSYEHPLSSEFQECLDAHKSMIELFESLSVVDCVRAKQGTDGQIVDVAINEDYLEKEAVQWWSLDRMRDALAGGGTLHNDTFRTYFLPVVEAVLATETALTA